MIIATTKSWQIIANYSWWHSRPLNNISFIFQHVFHFPNFQTNDQFLRKFGNKLWIGMKIRLVKRFHFVAFPVTSANIVQHPRSNYKQIFLHTLSNRKSIKIIFEQILRVFTVLGNIFQSSVTRRYDSNQIYAIIDGFIFLLRIIS